MMRQAGTHTWLCGCRVEVIVGSATDSIKQLISRGQRFDIAFLDADKTGYLGYYKQLMDNQLIVPGGLIVVDNALMKACPFCQGLDIPTACAALWQSR